MILNLWNLVVLRCVNHSEEKPHKMELKKTTHSIIYGCNKEECKNEISVDDFDKLISKLTKDIENAEFNNEIPDLTGNKYTIRGVIYKVAKYKTDYIVVDVLNKKVKGK